MCFCVSNCAGMSPLCSFFDLSVLNSPSLIYRVKGQNKGQIRVEREYKARLSTVWFIWAVLPFAV